MWEKIRAVILYIFCVTVFVVCASIYIPLIFIFKPEQVTWFRRFYGRVMIFASFNKLVVVSKPPTDNGPYLFIPNHQSMFDAFMIAAALPCHFSALGKREAFSIPIFGFIIKRFGIISIDRKDHVNSMAGVDLAVEKVKSGTSIVIFSEGTRTKNGQVGVFKKGAFKLALDSGATIVPVGISGSYDSQPTGSWILRPGVLKINFGRPVPYSEYQNLSIPQLSDLIRDQVIELSSNP